MEKFDFSSLTPEQKQKIRGLKTKEDILNFIEDQDIDLSEDQLRAISGGSDYWEDFNYQFKGD